MWRTGCVLRRTVPVRRAAGFCSNNTQILSSSSPDSHSPTRPREEKQKRRRQREEAILSRLEDAADKSVKWGKKQEITYTALTPPGTKKDTTVPFPDVYSPGYVESSWYQWWEKEGVFSPEQHETLPHAAQRTFSLCIPPPNVTGSLHLGHALTVAVEDALVRWRRMQGHKVLWVPGCDHAGIATQTVVERKLLSEKGKRRQDFTREEFLTEVWKWKNEKGGEIYEQLRSLGASLDWSRACFTMDPGFSRAVTEAFVRLCDSGLIYRSEALVNWSCALQSAISDIEVDSQELKGQTMLSVPGYEKKVEFGTMYSFAYPVDGHDEAEVTVSTTRPETMLGDVAVAVHPDDPRYLAFHGKQCRHPFTDGLLPIITDPLVDMTFGTGAVKVTPAHDHVDFQLSQRHSLPRLTVIRGDGTMIPPCGQWLEGVKRFDARRLVVNALAEKKLFRGKTSHAMSLPVCSRSGDVIEPLLKKQWFVHCEEMAKKAIQAVESGELEILPQNYTKTWKIWLSNISDWCISRQLWWGHQIPAYRVELPRSTDSHEERWVWGRSEDEARQRAAAKYGAEPESITLIQDPDVLDTWFSSGLFPFAMLGWPQQTTDLQHFYPNSLLETGSDLIFFWVARMVMLGQELTGQLPFKQVLFHSLVRDQHGRKMSKSLGNVIDPLDVIHGVSLEKLQEKVMGGNLDPRERRVAMTAQRKDFPQGIPRCGTDALRFALCSHKIQGDDINLSITHVQAVRHFGNKMWQTVRFTLGVLGGSTAPVQPLEQIIPETPMERWICSRLYGTVLQCEQDLEKYELHTVTSALKAFWVQSLCDVYLEYVKTVVSPQQQQHQDGGSPVPPCGDGARQVSTSVLYHCVSTSLTLLSPFMPFITEELWQRLQPFRPGPVSHPSLCLQPYPSSSSLAHWHFPEEEGAFLLVQEVARTARSLQVQCGLTNGRAAMWAVCSPDQARVLRHFGAAVWTLGRISNLHIYCPDEADALRSTAPPEGSVVGVVDQTCRLHLHVENSAKQISELSKRRDALSSKLDQVLSVVQAPEYSTEVSVRARKKNQSKMSVLRQELKVIEDQMKLLQHDESTE